MAHVSRSWALKAQWLILILLTGLASYLAYSHVVLTHGVATFSSLCNLGGTFNCDAVNTSAWSSLLGAPISAWALPVYGVMAWLSARGLTDDDRGAKARGALTLLAGFTVLMSVFMAYISFVEIGFKCLFCMSMWTLHAVSFGLTLVPGGKRALGLPATNDLMPAGVIAGAITVVAIGGSLVWQNTLDSQAVALIESGGGDVASERVASGDVSLPTAALHAVSVPVGAPTYGPADAPVTVVEFADFECGYCRKLSYTVSEMKHRYGDRVRFVFRHYPMDKACNDNVSRTHHPHACGASLAAQCALQQDRFWDYHDVLFRNQKRLELADLTLYAERLGLDVPAWQTCMDDVSFRQFLLTDIAEAKQLGITGTPRLYVNGREFRGAISERILDAAIRVALGEAEVDARGRVASFSTRMTAEPPAAGPIDMVGVRVGEQTFYMDAVEAHIDDDGAARSVVGAAPSPASWFTAQAACQTAGKRLCTQAEWLGACQAATPEDDDGDGNVFNDYLEGRHFPYGDSYVSGVCWDSLDRDSGAPTTAGHMAGCRTPGGVYDLAGNVQEWVGQDDAHALLAGGSWHYEDKASCGANYDVFGPGYSNQSTGFRCCADRPVPATALVQTDVLVTEASAAEAGDPMPPFTGATPNGGVFDSASLSGKVTLVNFWASWCGPCQREMPALKTLQADLEARGFTVVAVNVDRDSSKATRLLRRVEPNYPVVLDPNSEVMGAFDVMAMPTSVLVDRTGHVVMQHTGYSEAWFSELRAQIDAML